MMITYDHLWWIKSTYDGRRRLKTLFWACNLGSYMGARLCHSSWPNWSDIHILLGQLEWHTLAWLNILINHKWSICENLRLAIFWPDLPDAWAHLGAVLAPSWESWGVKFPLKSHFWKCLKKTLLDFLRIWKILKKIVAKALLPKPDFWFFTSLSYFNPGGMEKQHTFFWSSFIYLRVSFYGCVSFLRSTFQMGSWKPAYGGPEAVRGGGPREAQGVGATKLEK